MFDNGKFPELTKDGSGYVYWRGKQVEHFSYGNPDEEQTAARELAGRCRHLERLGITPSTATCVWFWTWLSSVRKTTVPFFNFLKQTPSCMYENEEKTKLVMQSRFSRIFEWDSESKKLSEITGDIETDVKKVGIYRVMEKRRFRIADAGQGSNFGICYADRFGMVKMLQSYNLPADFAMPE